MILSMMGDDLKKYVKTASYIDALNALNQNNIVLLLGEPMCGKSTIAALLCMSMIDKDKLWYMQVTNLHDLVTSWNTNEKQLFWLDDVFGATKFLHETAEEMNKLLNHISTMIKSGAKVIFTSRSYIYHEAKRAIKPNTSSLLNKAELVINVQKNTKTEREQILYNHIKYGDQTIEYKREIKPILPVIAALEGMNPEISRRLGNTHFTQKVSLSKAGILKFIESPLEFLLDSIINLDDTSIAALLLLFAHSNELHSPIILNEDDTALIESITNNTNAVKGKFEILRNDFVLFIESTTPYWKFKHPTFIEAMARYVSQHIELMDIFLKFSPLRMILDEVTCKTHKTKDGKMLLPVTSYDILIARISNAITEHRLIIELFLAYETDDIFLKNFYNQVPQAIGHLHRYNGINRLSSDGMVKIDRRLNAMGLIDDETRLIIYEYVSKCTLGTPDGTIFEDKELQDIIGTELLNHLIENIEDSEFFLVEGHVDYLKDYYLDGVLDYGGELDFISEAYDKFMDYIRDVDNELYVQAREAADRLLPLVENVIDDNREKEALKDDAYDDWKDRQYDAQNSTIFGDIFSDVDL